MASGKNRSSKNRSSKNKSSKNRSSKNNASKNNVSKNDSSKNNTSIVMRVVIILFAVVLVASLCLPFFSSCSSTSSTTETTTTTTTTSTTTSSTVDTSTVLGVQETYATLLESLEDRVAEDPTNLTNLVSLANNYMDCAFDMYEADDWADYEDDITDLFNTAASYYALYIALAEGDDSVSQDSINVVTVDGAVCRYYAGDAEQAIDMITTLLNDQPHYAMGWYNLGAIYEQEGDYENAAEAYYTVLEVDPDDETGAYTNAYYQLLLMEINGLIEVEDDEAESDAEDAEETETDTEDAEETADIEDDEAVDTENDETADTDEYDTATE